MKVELENVKPRYAWISAGRKNRYGHPHKDTLERLENSGVFTQAQTLIMQRISVSLRMQLRKQLLLSKTVPAL